MAHAPLGQQRHSLSKRVGAAKTSTFGIIKSTKSLSLNVSCKVCVYVGTLWIGRDFHQHEMLWEADQLSCV